MSEDILVEKKNGLGLITLNRPKALNALNHSMIQRMHNTLLAWENDHEVLAVVVQGAGDKAFCAGGDIRGLYDSMTSGSAAHRDFFRDEFALNEYIYRYPKPYIACMDGYVMGGGMGIAQGARYRVVTERSKVAMPEVAIGYFPDVGASHFLSRCPGRIGEYLAVTGITLGAEDALYSNLADWFLPHDQVPVLLEKLQQLTTASAVNEQITQCLLGLGAKQTADDAPLAQVHSLIDDVFLLTHVQNIMDALDVKASQGNAWCADTSALMKKRSPIAMVASLKLIRLGKQLGITECFKLELALNTHWEHVGDFVEGVRALIIAKDNQPQWRFQLSELTQDKTHGLLPLLIAQ